MIKNKLLILGLIFIVVFVVKNGIVELFVWLSKSVKIKVDVCMCFIFFF